MVTDTPQQVRPTLADEAIKISPEVKVRAIEDVQDTESKISIEQASTQLHLDLDLDATHIISSPYSDLANQLRLESLDIQSRLFAFALTYFNRVQDDYTTAPYTTAFNWSYVFEVLRELCRRAGVKWKKQEFYVVIFRSKLLADADRARLGKLDQKSHEEACASGGLLHYWFGSINAERQNLATCMWVTREDAAAGGRGPWHKKARGAARDMYETISFHTHMLVVDDGASSWQLEDFVG